MDFYKKLQVEEDTLSSLDFNSIIYGLLINF